MFFDLNSAISLQLENARFYLERGAVYRRTNSYSETMRDYSAFTEKIPIQKRRLMCRPWGVIPTPWGCLGQAVAAGRTRQLRKGSQIAPKGVADLLLEGRGHRRWPSAVAQGRRCVAVEPPQRLSFRRSRKCAQMRFCQNLIYLLILYKEKHYNPRRTLRGQRIYGLYNSAWRANV
jgi:hypothetical protein